MFHVKHRPYGYLKAEQEAGEGTVRLTEGFDRQTTTFRLDILGDWIQQLTELRDELTTEVYEPQETTDGRSAIRG